MVSQNQFTANNSSNGNVFSPNTTNNNLNQVNNNPLNLQNSHFVPSNNIQNTQGNSFFVNNQQPAIMNQKPSDPNLLFRSFNNNQQMYQNSAQSSPQFCYNNYQSIANELA